MNEKLNHIPWDSALFGGPVFELRYEGVPDESNIALLDKECAARKAVMAFAKIGDANIGCMHFLENAGFRYMESQFKITRGMAEPFSDSIYNRFFSLEKLDADNERTASEVLEIVNTTFDTDRYILDPRLKPELAKKRYANWFRSLLSGENCESFVYRNKKSGDIAGFLSVRNEEAGIYLALGGVSGKFKGLGIYGTLLADYLNHAFAGGKKNFLTFISGHNTGVFNIYIHLGFKIAEETVVLRKIYSENAEVLR